MRKIYLKWERIACFTAGIACLLCCAIGIMFTLKRKDRPSTPWKYPVIKEIFPWDSLPEDFLTTAIPNGTMANPFGHVLKSHLKKSLPEAKKDKATTAPLAKTPHTPEPAKAEKPKETPPPQSKTTLSITYKGFYIDVKGEPTVLLALSKSDLEKTDTVACRLGEIIFSGVKLAEFDENKITVDIDGKRHSISWMERSELPLN